MVCRPAFAFGALLLALPLVAPAQQPAAGGPPPQSTPLPLDPQVTIGTLPNGLKYYIRTNAKPERRAELRLVVNAGSILEDADQLGYAHFVEHMAFNGTTHFKKNELVNYLQSIGVQFGAHLNAYTSFDETVYILQVPTDTSRIVEKAFQVLADWAHGQLFDSTEVVNERGVVVEEWRSGKGAGERMQKQTLPIMLKGSRYAERLPIGNEESIRAANPAALRRFYQDWYRTDLMAVVAVGDFNKAQIEQLIRQHFGPIPAPRNPRPRVPATVPNNSTPLIAIATDHEATSSGVTVGFKLPTEATRTVGDYRTDLIEGMYLGMINNRLYEMTRKPDAPFTGASMSLSGFFARNTDAFTLGAGVKDGGIEAGLEAVLVELKRADDFGFLQSELDRSKTNYLRSYERSYNERATQTHGAYVGSYVSNFLSGAVFTGIDYSYPLVQQLIPTITLAEVNGLARKWISEDNRIIMATAPRKAGVKVPTEAGLLAVFDRAANATVTAYTETVTDAPLIERMPTPGRIVRERVIEDIGVTEWTLSNGARVYVKATDFKADEILFTGFSDGGTSLVENRDYMSASMATSIVGNSGVGKFSSIDLGKKLTGKSAGASTGISGYSESISGSAAPQDLETMMQLAYLRFTAPRVDTAVFLANKQRTLVALANRNVSPGVVFGDTINATMSQNDFRSRPPTPALYEEIDLQKAFAFYQDRFADAGDWTFGFVGNISLPTLKPLVEQYLASLPTAGRKEMWREVTNPPPKGVIDKTVRKGTEQRATTQIFFTGPFEWTQENRFALSALTALFQIKLTESLREQLGGTYSPGSGGSASRIPREQYTISISYPSAPANVDKLTASVFALIDSLQTAGPSAEDVAKVREQFTRSTEVARKTNSYWLGTITPRDQPIDDVAKVMATADALVKNLTPAQIQAAAKLYFNKANYARFILLPDVPQ